jgi:hypothetical protein
MVFTAVSSKKALKKRKRRFTPTTMTDKMAAAASIQLKKSSLEAEEKVVVVVNRLLAKWRANPISGGTNNSISAAGIQVIAKKLHAKRSFNSSSVLCKDAATDLSSNFYVEHGISHIMVFDACFGANALERLYRRLSRTKDFSLVGCSTAKTRPYWQKHMKQLGGSTKSVKMCGRGASSFRFAVWKLVA